MIKQLISKAIYFQTSLILCTLYFVREKIFGTSSQQETKKHNNPGVEQEANNEINQDEKQGLLEGISIQFKDFVLTQRKQVAYCLKEGINSTIGVIKEKIGSSTRLPLECESDENVSINADLPSKQQQYGGESDQESQIKNQIVQQEQEKNVQEIVEQQQEKETEQQEEKVVEVVQQQQEQEEPEQIQEQQEQQQQNEEVQQQQQEEFEQQQEQVVEQEQEQQQEIVEEKQEQEIVEEKQEQQQEETQEQQQEEEEDVQEQEQEVEQENVQKQEQEQQQQEEDQEQQEELQKEEEEEKQEEVEKVNPESISGGKDEEKEEEEEVQEQEQEEQRKYVAIFNGNSKFCEDIVNYLRQQKSDIVCEQVGFGKFSKKASFPELLGFMLVEESDEEPSESDIKGRINLLKKKCNGGSIVLLYKGEKDLGDLQQYESEDNVKVLRVKASSEDIESFVNDNLVQNL